MKLLSILTAGVALTSTAFAADAGDYRRGAPARAVIAVAPGAPVADRILSRTDFANADAHFGTAKRSLFGSLENAAADAEAHVRAEEVAERFARMRIAR